MPKRDKKVGDHLRVPASIDGEKLGKMACVPRNPGYRKLLLIIALISGAVTVEEMALGYGKRMLQAAFGDTAGEYDNFGGRRSSVPDIPSSASPPEVATDNRVEIDGFYFQIEGISKKEFLDAYNLAKSKVGGPYHTAETNKGWKIEVVPENTATNIGSRGVVDPQNRLVQVAKAGLAHELAHLLLGVEIKSGKWPAVLGELLAHSLSPDELAYQRYGLTQLDNPFISMLDPNAASSPGGNFLTDARIEALQTISKSLPDELRIKIVTEASKRGTITFDELPALMAQFGIRHNIFKKGDPGVQKRVLLGKEKGEEFLLPIIYEKLADGTERPVNGELTVKFLLRNGAGPSVKLAVGTSVRNTYPIMLPEFLSFANVARYDLVAITIDETGQRFDF